MTDVTFRPFTRADRDDYLRLLGSIWDYASYSDDVRIRDMLIRLDGYAALHASSYQEIATYEGQLTGVLFASPRGERRRLSFLQYALRLIGLFMRLLFYSRDSRRALLNLKRILRAYESLTHRSKQTYKNEVTLFMVDKRYRGKHIGVKMIERYEAFLRKKGENHYYLFTDEFCSYTFYDHHGFTLEGDRTVHEKLKSGPSTMKVMLYSKRLENPSDKDGEE